MKKIFGLFLVVIILAAAWVFSKDNSEELMGSDLQAFVYTSEGQPIGGGIISVPFIKDVSGQAYYSHVAIDANENSQYEDNEWVAQNAPARIYSDYRNNFPVDFSGLGIDTSKSYQVIAVLSSDAVEGDPRGNAAQTVEANVSITPHELSDILGLNVPGASEDLKRGPGEAFSLQINKAQAQNQTAAVSASRNANVPDLGQGSMECSAVSTANNLISLAGEHGALDKLPQNARDLIEELKTDMQFNNGILNSNFKAGKDAFVARHNLPITTRRISNPSFDDLATALNSGGAVELSTRMIQSASGQANTGHTMTLVGANQTASGAQSVQVHDSASPTGADTLQLNKAQTPSGQEFIVVEYPLWDGVVIVDDIFVQNWTEPEQAQTGDSTQTGEETSRIEVLVIGGSYYPKSQFRVAGPDVCDSDHYHAGTVYGLQNKTSTTIVNMNDPAPNGCGFGRVAEVPVEWIDITLEQSAELIKHLPN